jgi:acyl-coenzyme A thioesterase PaaI-like protein
MPRRPRAQTQPRATGTRSDLDGKGGRPSEYRFTIRRLTADGGGGQYFVAIGRVVRLGGRVAVAHMELVNDTDEQIATGSGAYIVG